MAPVRMVVEFALDRLAYAAAEGLVAPLSNGAGKVNLVLIGVYVRPRELDTEDASPDAA